MLGQQMARLQLGNDENGNPGRAARRDDNRARHRSGTAPERRRAGLLRRRDICRDRLDHPGCRRPARGWPLRCSIWRSPWSTRPRATIWSRRGRQRRQGMDALRDQRGDHRSDAPTRRPSFENAALLINDQTGELAVGDGVLERVRGYAGVGSAPGAASRNRAVAAVLALMTANRAGCSAGGGRRSRPPSCLLLPSDPFGGCGAQARQPSYHRDLRRDRAALSAGRRASLTPSPPISARRSSRRCGGSCPRDGRRLTWRASAPSRRTPRLFGGPALLAMLIVDPGRGTLLPVMIFRNDDARR